MEFDNPYESEAVNILATSSFIPTTDILLWKMNNNSNTKITISDVNNYLIMKGRIFCELQFREVLCTSPSIHSTSPPRIRRQLEIMRRRELNENVINRLPNNPNS